MKSLDINWQKVFKIQLFLSALLSIYILFFQQMILRPASRIGLSIICITFISNLIQIKHHFYHKFVQWLNILFLPICFSMLWQITAWLVVGVMLQLKIIVMIVFWIIALLIFVPVIIVSMKPVNNWLARLLIINLTAVEYDYLIFKENLSQMPWLDAFNDSLAILILIFSLQTIILNKAWFKRKKINLINKTEKYKNWFTWFLLIFTIWFIGFRVFVYIAPTFSSALWNWGVNFYGINPTIKILCQSVKSGVVEELERYLMVMTILFAFPKNKHRISYIVVISSVIFGIIHFINLMGGQGTAQTTDQAITAISLGIWLVVLYLYFGKIWIDILVHTIVDLITMSVNNRSLPLGFTWFSNYSYYRLIPGFLATIIPIILLVLILFGKQRKIVDQNLDKLLAN